MKNAKHSATHRTNAENTHLFVLDGLGELVPEREVGDGHVVHNQVELFCAVGQLVADASAHGLTLAQQLLRVVLGHHGLQHLHAAVIVITVIVVFGGVAVGGGGGDGGGGGIRVSVLTLPDHYGQKEGRKEGRVDHLLSPEQDPPTRRYRAQQLSQHACARL